MEDLRSQIARTAILNHQIIDLASAKPEFQACTRMVLNEWGASPELKANYAVKGSAAHHVSLLYCLILVPKELYVWPQNHVFYTEPGLRKAIGLFSTRIGNGENAQEDAKCFERNPAYYLIRRLRNSLAHANFSIWLESETFEFRDRKPGKEQDDFSATIRESDLGKFLSAVGHLFASYEVAQEKGH